MRLLRTGTIALNDWPICQLNTPSTFRPEASSEPQLAGGVTRGSGAKQTAQAGAVVADGRVLRPPPPGVPPSRLGLCLSDGAHGGRPGAEDLDRTVATRVQPGAATQCVGLSPPPGSGGHPPPVCEWPVHASSSLIRTGSTLGGRSPLWRVWPCAGEWHPAFRHAPAAGPWACPCSAASARPSPRVPRSRAGSYTCGLCASRGAQAGGVRPLPPPATRRCRRAVPPYAVPRRTRRRGDAVRGAAVPAGWDRRRAGTACACCARYSTSWSPASSSSCSWIML